MEKKQHMIRCYDQLYSTTSNFKEQWDGRIATEYKVPKYIKTFISTFRGKAPMDVLELGAFADGALGRVGRRVFLVPAAKAFDLAVRLGLEAGDLRRAGAAVDAEHIVCVDFVILAKV